MKQRQAKLLRGVALAAALGVASLGGSPLARADSGGPAITWTI